MARTPVLIRLNPNRCDRCYACANVCQTGALRVGASYLFLDWRACGECYRCVEACSKGAIVRLKRSRKDFEGATGRGAKAKPVPRSRSDGGLRADRTAGASGKSASATWRPIDAAAVLAVVFAALLLKNWILGSAWVQDLTETGVIAARVLILLGFYALQLAFLLILARRRGGFASAFSLGRTGGRWTSWVTAGGLVLALMVATRAAGWAYQVVVRALGLETPLVVDVPLTSIFGPGVMGLVLSVVFVVFLAPLTEELVFRRVLLEALGTHMGPWFALVVQALLFALYHLTPWLFGPAFVLGIACGWLAQRRATLWPAIALHAAYNALLVAAAFYLGGHLG